MKREAMKVGMEVKHRLWPHGNWRVGVIVEIYEDGPCPVRIDDLYRIPTWCRAYDQIEPLDTRKEAKS